MSTRVQPLRLDRLKTRAQFLRAATGVRAGTAGLGLQMIATPDPVRDDAAIRVGFTCSKKVGGAVQRNRAKRRLREAARALMPLTARGGHDYVLIGRPETVSRRFSLLLDDLAAALKVVHRRADAAARSAP